MANIKSSNAAGEDGEGADGDGENADQSEGTKAAKTSAPSATLEPSFDAINMKSVDLAFTVDPLFQKTSAQFDEGGARGLLLSNLSVYGGCTLAFDSHIFPPEVLESTAEGGVVEKKLIQMSGLDDVMSSVRRELDWSARASSALVRT